MECGYLLFVSMTVIGCIITVSATADFISPENRLYRDLMVNYDKNIRPMVNPHEQMKVNASFSVRKLESLNEKSQFMTTFGWIALFWTDELLRWDPTLYNDTYRLVVSSSQIWIPEIAMFNSVEQGSDMSLDTKFRVSILFDGSVFWGPGFKWQTGCSVNLKYFPFDTQLCNVTFINWMYGVDSLTINVTPGVETSNLESNDEWEVQSARSGFQLMAADEEGDMIVPTIFFELTLLRRPTYFLVHVVVPVVLISLMSALVFLLPSQAGEKVSLSITVFLAYTVVLLMVSDVTPKSSDTLPLITVYIIMSMSQTGLSLALTVWILSVNHHSPDRPVPGCIRSLVLGCMSTAICFYGFGRRPEGSGRVSPSDKEELVTNEKMILQDIEQKQMDAEKRKMASGDVLPDDVIAYVRQQMARDEERRVEQSNQAEWEEVARILDRFFLYAFLVLTALEIMAFICSLYFNVDIGEAM